MKYYNVREFAKKMGISPKRLSDLVKQNEVRTNEAGQIPGSEVQYFIREKFKKYLKVNRNSYLVLTAGKSAEEANQIFVKAVKSFNETSPELIQVDSIVELFSLVEKESIAEPDNETLNMMLKQFQKTLLKEFVERFQKIVFRIITKIADTASVRSIPVGSLYELLMYGKTYNETGDSQYLSLLSKGVVSNGSTTLSPKENGIVPIKEAESSFKALAVSLGLTDDNGHLFFRWGELSPEILHAISQMSVTDIRIPDNDFIRGLMQVSLKTYNNATKRSECCEAKKILNTVIMQNSRILYNSSLFKVARKGFCTCRILENISKPEAESLAREISGGYYKNIYLIGSEINNTTNFLIEAVKVAHANRVADVRILSNWD